MIPVIYLIICFGMRFELSNGELNFLLACLIAVLGAITTYDGNWVVTPGATDAEIVAKIQNLLLFLID